MSSVARKLVKDIVDPPLLQETSSTLIAVTPRTRVSQYREYRNNTVEKNRNVSNISRHTMKNTKSNDFKNVVARGVNTTITGSLKCDSNCITLVRRRDNADTCRCSQRRLCPNLKPQDNQKFIQPFNKSYLRLDKACSNCIDTNSCGTQILEVNNVGSRKTKPIHSMDVLESEPRQCNIQTVTAVKPTLRNTGTRPENFEIPARNSDHVLNTFGVKRWALSHRMRLGPDF